MQAPTRSQAAIGNRILDPAFHPSSNFYSSDRIFRHLLERSLSIEGRTYMAPKLEHLGSRVAKEMDELSMTADKHGPELRLRNHYGETVNHIAFHPAYDRLMAIAVESEMFYVKWEPDMRYRFAGENHALGFAAGYLFAMGESGQYCPLAMTDGVARLIDRYAEPSDQHRLMPHIYTMDPAELYTGAMFLTEKAGGSDVGANLVTATHEADNLYRLNGEKWFCSNANADIIFALARPEGAPEGTKGLSIFLVEKTLADGSPNPMRIMRLKDKLGVRSMASAEILMTDTIGKRVGQEHQGFKIMADMINLQRLYNAVAAVGGSRRGLAEAYQFLQYRPAFGQYAIEHALVRRKLHELGSHHLANCYLTWRAIQALDRADNGDEREAHLVRLLTPIIKKWTAEKGVYMLRESMELMGGQGYIEDGVMPKLLRDALVLPIWEGAGNIMVLDMVRAAQKTEGLQYLLADISAMSQGRNLFDINAEQHEAIEQYGQVMQRKLSACQQVAEQLFQQERETVEATAAPLFEQLAQLYAMGLMIQNLDSTSRGWVIPALQWWARQLEPSQLQLEQPPELAQIQQLIGWDQTVAGESA
jgi:alkylation response protein AidB-like acyl-CoA dehydrogenase